MKLANWKVIGMIALAIYGMFGVIHADAVGVSASMGNFLAASGGIALALVAVILILDFVSSAKSRDKQ